MNYPYKTIEKLIETRILTATQLIRNQFMRMMLKR